MRYFVTLGATEHEVVVREHEDGGFTVDLDGRTLRADLSRLPGEDIFSLLLDGKSFELLVSPDRLRTTVVHHGQGVDLLVESDRERNARLISAEAVPMSGETVRAVMPGIVVSVAVTVGNTVTAGQPLLVLEAMKMENEIRCRMGGIVEKVHVERGKTVQSGDVLVDIKSV